MIVDGFGYLFKYVYLGLWIANYVSVRKLSYFTYLSVSLFKAESDLVFCHFPFGQQQQMK